MESWELQQMQDLPLELKIIKSQLRIREWYDYWQGDVYVSFSGGKDSTVLLHLVRSLYPGVPAVYCDTGLEYPEIRRFALGHENVGIVRPAMNFKEVIQKYGYPVISKEQAKFIYEVRTTSSEYMRDCRLNGKLMDDGTRGRMGRVQEKWKFLLNAPFKISPFCCEVMKKKPMKQYEKESGRRMMTGEMAEESRRRKSMYLMYGCNAFETQRPKSAPLGFWTEQDILRYLKEHAVPYCEVYGDIAETTDGQLRTTGCERTGCMFCMFGVHLDGAENRFIRMQRTHPKLWKYCIYDLNLKQVLNYIAVPYASIFEEALDNG